MECSGICTTDRHIYAGRIPAPVPSILGHELIGTLERPGPGLIGDTVQAGERVLVAPGVDCGRCGRCRRGARGCVRRRVYGMTFAEGGLSGGFATAMTLVERTRVFRLPEDIPARRLIFAEITACIASGLRKAFGRAGIPRGADLAVLGFGPAGLAAASFATWAGHHPVVVESDPRRLSLARSLGFATSQLGRRCADIVLECAGTPAAFARAFEMLRPSGTLVEFGNAADLGTVVVKPSAICLNDLRIVGSAETLYDDFPDAIAAVAETPIDLATAVNDVHAFEALTDPNALFEQNDTVFKAVLDFAPQT